jgi:uncharacterized protein with HEPN domain
MRDPRVIIVDILDAIDAAREASLEKSYEAFAENRLARLATERAIEIISEAVRRLPNEMMDRHPDIEWVKIKAIGNILRHEYHRIAPKIIWDAVQFELEGLERALKAELE